MKKKPLRLIPRGMYCYKPLEVLPEGGILIKRCPYWSIDDSKPVQENGYCSYLGRGDWEFDGISLLWDQIKECGIKW